MLSSQETDDPQVSQEMALKLTKWAHYSLDEKEKGKRRSPENNENEEDRESNGEEERNSRKERDARRAKLALTTLSNSNRSREEKGGEGLQAG